MIPVVVFSNEKFAVQLRRTLGELCTTSYISDREIKINKNSQLLLVERKKIKSDTEPDGILVICQRHNCVSECGFSSIVIADSSNKTFKSFLIDSETEYITCGMSSMDTVNFSSIHDQEVSVSVMRNVKDINGNTVEPFEVSIFSKTDISKYPPFYLLSFVALATVLGITLDGKRIVFE